MLSLLLWDRSPICFGPLMLRLPIVQADELMPGEGNEKQAYSDPVPALALPFTPRLNVLPILSSGRAGDLGGRKTTKPIRPPIP